MKKLVYSLTAAILLAIPSIAFAHAAYRDSDPKDESTIATPPSSVWAEYTEPVQDGYLHVYDPCGARVDDDDTQATGYRMTVDMASDKSGTYQVQWRAASAVDPHVTQGVFTFTVTDGEPCPGAEPAEEEETNDSENGSGSDETSGSVGAAGGGGGSGGGGSGGGGSGTDDERGSAKDAKSTGTGTHVAGTRIRSDEAAEPALAQEQAEAEERGLFEGMRWGAFAVAMLIAAAIGAAGGRIYAGIMGPRR